MKIFLKLMIVVTMLNVIVQSCTRTSLENENENSPNPEVFQESDPPSDPIPPDPCEDPEDC